MALLIAAFVIGYFFIAAEELVKINKTATALITGCLCWALLAFEIHTGANDAIAHHIGDIAGILLFLMGAMTIVELIDLHDGFSIITNRIKAKNMVKLLWIISLMTFVLSAILDNLTTAIVMCSLLQKIIDKPEDRRFFAGMVVIAANSGGAFSPIGDVTTTMLWLGGQITAGNIMLELFLPSLVSLLVPLLFVSFIMRGKYVSETDVPKNYEAPRGSRSVLFIGVAALVFVPIFKTITHLPPYMGILLGLGVVWLATEIIHRGEEHVKQFSAMEALSRIDLPSILFFFGILAAVASLDTAGLLHQLATAMDVHIGNKDLIVGIIGVASAIIDNVPLVAASMGMYDLAQYPADSRIWEFLAYAAGTGGSILIIGSAAGVAVMGMERISFMWYLRRISLLALLGYIAGAFTYILMYQFMNPA